MTKAIIPRLLLSVACLAAALFVLSCPSTTTDSRDTTEELFTLTILHTNDTHARILEFNDHGNTCGQEESDAGECFGGVARRATPIYRIRNEEPNVILADAGDQFQGTLFYTWYKGEGARVFMNKLGYDIMTLGNHEFDEGPAKLAEFIDGLDFPVVSSNIDFRQEPLLVDLVRPYDIIEVAGEEIGVIGFTTTDVPEISKPGPNVSFREIESSVRGVLAELENLEVNKIIALSHAGFATDMELAEAIEGIDVIVGGHTHTYLSNTDPEAEGTYPTMVTSPADEPVLVVTAKAWGKYLGHLTVKFDDEGVIQEWSGEPILLDSSVPEDEVVLAEALRMSEALEPLREFVVGETAVDLVAGDELCRFEECNLGNLITDAMMWETRSQGVQIALFNGGGVRASMPAGVITVERVLEVFPFFDTLATLKLTGADFREVLEYGVSRAESTQNEGTGRFLQVAGVHYTWDPNKPVGSRIVDVEVASRDGSYSPLDDGALYSIATSDFLRNGGDGFDILRHRAIDPYDFGRVLSDIFVEYLEEFSPVAPELEGRIKRAP